jgi:predicted dehydrogenase
VVAGRIGKIRHIRAQYLQDWIVDPHFPLVWRLRKEMAGSGALGDIGSHIIDLIQHISGERLSGVCALQETFVKERPLPNDSHDLSAHGDIRVGAVTVDDATAFLGRLTGGGMVVAEATRFANGRKNALRLEINGSRGSLAFDFESMNELSFYDGSDPHPEAGFRRILVTEPTHPYLSAWWPPGHGLGYEHAFVHEIRDFLLDLARGIDPEPSFADGLQVQQVLDGIERSAAADSTWMSLT